MEQWFKNEILNNLGNSKDYDKLKYIYILYQYLDEYYSNSLYPVNVEYKYIDNSRQLRLINTKKDKDVLLIDVKSHQIEFYNNKGEVVETLSLSFDANDFRERILHYIKKYLNDIRINLI